MKYWTEADMAAGHAPRKVLRIRAAASDAIEDCGWPGVEVVRVGRSDNEQDVCRFEVDVQLAPGVILPTWIGTSEGVIEGYEDKAEDIGLCFDNVAEGVAACRDLTPDLIEMLDGLRRRSRSIVAGWQREGLPVEFVDVRLAPYDHWRGDTVPETLVLVETLNEGMRRGVEEVQAQKGVDLERALGEVRSNLIERKANRIALAERGATGTIDQLALNAIARFHDVDEFLRQYAAGERFWLPDRTAVHMRDGHVSAGTGISTGRVDWHGDSLTYSTTRRVSQQELDEAVGRPAAELIPHDFLSDDIVVTSVDALVEGERQFVSVALRMPRHLFCNVTGRVWPRDAEAPEGDSVVPFRSRAV